MNDRLSKEQLVANLPTKSARIRALAEAGYKTADIADFLNISYQHAYNVLNAGGRGSKRTTHAKSALDAETLRRAGFQEAAAWALNTQGIELVRDIPKYPGVYAFVSDGEVLYVGSASRSLKQRLYGYAKPGSDQKTNIRINETILRTLRSGNEVTVWIAIPGDSSWNGLPVDLSLGLEQGLINTYRLPWNKRGT